MKNAGLGLAEKFQELYHINRCCQMAVSLEYRRLAMPVYIFQPMGFADGLPAAL
jgi:hypothetical protein